MNLLLFGFKASGKTHFGKLAANHLRRPFIDLDDLVVNLYGKKQKVKEIYKKLGEKGFRELEKKAIGLLKGLENSIIALGGGTVLDLENVQMLQKLGALIYLKADSAKLKKRIFQEELPPLLAREKPEEAFWEMVQQREPIYRSIPARCVDTDLLDEAGVVAAICSILLLEEPPNGL
jgi:shikimate kinase